MVLFDTFKDTIFLKDTTELHKKYNALIKLNKEYPDSDSILEELYMVQRGLSGENEIKYQLEKSNLGMYVLRDITLEYEGMKAQIDFVVITKMYCYFLECKNLNGNITVNNNGDFIIEYLFKGKKYKKGIYSPLRQVEAQRDVFKKIWNNCLSSNKVINYVKRLMSEKNFTDTYRVLVVVANYETLLNTKYAPWEIKDKVIRADNLIRKIEDDLNKSDKSLWDTKKGMEEWANTFLKASVDIDIDYYDYYKRKYNLYDIDKDLEESLIKFRKERSSEMNIPAYYVFNNEELNKLVEKKPRSLEELTGIIDPIKLKVHGNLIVEIINK